MKVVKFVSSVDPSKCNGDKLCERVCPTGAISVVNKEARVEQTRCVACSKCWDRCPSDAIAMVPRR
ncbi:MAG: 4Fe-4S binding protein, partial [Thermodesulfobacteriota bacterium]